MKEYLKFWINPLRYFCNSELTNKIGIYEIIDDTRDGAYYYITLEEIKIIDIDLYKLLKNLKAFIPKRCYKSYIYKTYSSNRVNKYLYNNKKSTSFQGVSVLESYFKEK
jgi:hypothetical protein